MSSNLFRSRRSFMQRYSATERDVSALKKRPAPTRIASAAVTSSKLETTLASTIATRTAIYRQVAAPTGSSLVDGDLWIDSDNGNAVYLRVSSAWVSIPFGPDAVTGLAVLAATNTFSGAITVNAAFGRGAPVTKTSNFTVGDSENWIICNTTATCTVTLPTASLWTGREIMIKTIAAFAVNSASSNVHPITSATAGTAILPATDGSWATLVSNGSNWVIMQNG